MPRWNPRCPHEGKSTSVPYTKQQLQEFFKKYDIDGDKFLSKEELKKAFKDLHSHWPWFRVQEAMAKADVNGDKRISPQEMDAFLDYVVKLQYSVEA